MIGEPRPVKRNRHPERIVLVTVPGLKCTRCGHTWARRKGRDVKACRDQCPKCLTQLAEYFVPFASPVYRCTKCDIRWRAYLHNTGRDYVECKRCKARRAVDYETGVFV